MNTGTAHAEHPTPQGPTGRPAAPGAGATTRAGTLAAGERPVPDPGRRPPGQRSLLRSVAVPAEHGGWGLTAEPVLLGLLVAPSASGALIGAMTVLAFLSRTPVKLALVDRWRHRRLPRTAAAERVAAAELTLLGGLAVVVAMRSGSSWWLPLAVAAPLVAVELWFDIRSRGRRLAPELCGAAGIASAAAAIARAGGASWAVSIGLWLVLAARSTGAIPFARSQVLRYRGRQAATRVASLWQATAVAVALAGWAAGAVPLAALVAVAAMAVWASWALHRPVPPVKVLGFTQLGIGLALVLVTAGALRLG